MIKKLLLVLAFILIMSPQAFSAGIFQSGGGSTDTGPSPDCSGTTTYQDGEGNCDDLSLVYQPLEATLTDIADGTIDEDLVNTANPWADNEVADNITLTNISQVSDVSANGASLVTAANYAAMRTLLDLESGTDFYSIAGADAQFLALSGGTLTGEVTADDLGIEFTPGDTLTDCSTFAATGGGIFYDDSEGKFKKCEDNSLTDLDTTGGTPSFSTLTGGTNTAAAMVVGTGASMSVSGSGTIAATTSTALAANGANCSAGNAPLGVDANGAVESCFDVWTEAENTAAAYGDVTDVYSCASGDCNSMTIATGELLDGGTATVDAEGEGIQLPRGTSCTGATAEGQVCWDTDNDKLYVGDGALGTVQIGIDTLSGLTDTTITTPSDDQHLVYSSGSWVNTNPIWQTNMGSSPIYPKTTGNTLVVGDGSGGDDGKLFVKGDANEVTIHAELNAGQTANAISIHDNGQTNLIWAVEPDGDQVIQKDDATIFMKDASASETNWLFGPNTDGNLTADDPFEFSTGTTKGSNVKASLSSDGKLTVDTVIGSTASGGNLNLQSTSNATKGKILFGTSAYDEVNNRLGIAKTSPTAEIDVTGIGKFTASVSDTTTNNLLAFITANTTASNTKFYRAMFADAYAVNSGFTNSGYLKAFEAEALQRDSGTTATVAGAEYTAGNYGPAGGDHTGIITNLYGVKSTLIGRASATIGDAYGYQVTLPSVGTISTATYGFSVAANTLASGTNKYGYHTGNLSGATNNYGFYSDVNSTGYQFYGNGTGASYFGGNVGIGATSASAKLDVGGGTATSIDGTDDLLVKDDVEIDGDLYVEGSYHNTLRFIVVTLVASGTDVAVATSIGGDFRVPFTGTLHQSDTTPYMFACDNSTAGTTGTQVVDVHLNGTTVMTTNKIDTDTAEKSSGTGATLPDLTTTAVTAGDILTFDVDAVHTTPAKGLRCTIAIRET